MPGLGFGEGPLDSLPLAPWCLQGHRHSHERGARARRSFPEQRWRILALEHSKETQEAFDPVKTIDLLFYSGGLALSI